MQIQHQWYQNSPSAPQCCPDPPCMLPVLPRATQQTPSAPQCCPETPCILPLPAGHLQTTLEGTGSVAGGSRKYWVVLGLYWEVQHNAGTHLESTGGSLDCTRGHEEAVGSTRGAGRLLRVLESYRQ